MSIYPEAMEYLLGGADGTLVMAEAVPKKESAEPFELPPRNDNMRRVYAYLLTKRRIDKDVLNTFARHGMIYESADYHNAVFIGYDQDGVPRHASYRGTRTESTFRGNKPSSTPEYSFHWNGKSDRLYLFEAPIDMLSYISMHKDGWRQHSYAAACGVSDRVLFQMLKDNPSIKTVCLCLDNDDGGRKAVNRISAKLYAQGIRTEVLVPSHKDWNEDLLYPPTNTEAEVVRRIFSLYLKGYGAQAITAILNKDGIPRRNGQSRWYSKSLMYILTNERYMGDALLQKKYRTETLPHRTMRNDGKKAQYYVENSNPPIISREMFEAAQALLKSKGSFDRQRKRFPLTSIMVCPECGMRFRRQIIDGVTYWICNGRASGASQCQSRRVRENMVYDAFISMADKLADNRKYLLGTLIGQIELLQSKTSKSQERVREIDQELADLGARNLVIARLHTSGVLNATDYATQTAEIGKKITELRIERRKKLSEDEDDELLDDLRSLDEIMSEYIHTNTFNEELFGQIVDQITVDYSTQITFRLIGGIELTEPINEKGRCKTA